MAMPIVAARFEKPAQLNSVVTATTSGEELSAVLPEMTKPNEFAAPGPVRVAAVQLSSGHAATVVFHERKQFLEILAPIESGIEKGLADALVELRVTPSA